jgi:hypothetical protein
VRRIGRPGAGPRNTRRGGGPLQNRNPNCAMRGRTMLLGTRYYFDVPTVLIQLIGVPRFSRLNTSTMMIALRFPPNRKDFSARRSSPGHRAPGSGRDRRQPRRSRRHGVRPRRPPGRTRAAVSPSGCGTGVVRDGPGSAASKKPNHRTPRRWSVQRSSWPFDHVLTSKTWFCRGAFLYHSSCRCVKAGHGLPHVSPCTPHFGTRSGRWRSTHVPCTTEEVFVVLVESA